MSNEALVLPLFKDADDITLAEVNEYMRATANTDYLFVDESFDASLEFLHALLNQPVTNQMQY